MSNQITIPASTQVEQEMQKRFVALAASAKAIVVKDEESLAEAADLGKLANDAIKALEADRVKLVKPLNDHVTTINARYKRPMAALKAIVEELRTKATAWTRAEADRRRKEAEAATEKMAEELEQAGDHEAADAILDIGVENVNAMAKVKAVSESGAQTVTRRTKKQRVDDIRLLCLAVSEAPALYAKFVEPNMQALRAAHQAGEGAPAGVTFYEEDEVSFR